MLNESPKYLTLPKAKVAVIEEVLKGTTIAKQNNIDHFYETCLIKGMLLGFYGLQKDNRSPFQRRLKTIFSNDHPVWNYFLNTKNMSFSDVYTALRSTVEYGVLNHFYTNEN